MQSRYASADEHCEHHRPGPEFQQECITEGNGVWCEQLYEMPERTIDLEGRDADRDPRGVFDGDRAQDGGKYRIKRKVTERDGEESFSKGMLDSNRQDVPCKNGSADPFLSASPQPKRPDGREEEQGQVEFYAHRLCSPRDLPAGQLVTRPRGRPSQG